MDRSAGPRISAGWRDRWLPGHRRRRRAARLTPRRHGLYVLHGCNDSRLNAGVHPCFREDPRAAQVAVVGRVLRGLRELLHPRPLFLQPARGSRSLALEHDIARPLRPGVVAHKYPGRRRTYRIKLVVLDDDEIEIVESLIAAPGRKHEPGTI